MLVIIIVLVTLAAIILFVLNIVNYIEQLNKIKRGEVESILKVIDGQLCFKAHRSLSYRKLYVFNKQIGVVPISCKEDQLDEWKERLGTLKDVWEWENNQLQEYENYVREEIIKEDRI